MTAGTRAELLEPGEAASLAEAWDGLAARAIEPNVFLARWMSEARLRHLPDRRGARLLVAWRGEGGVARLVGLALLVRPRGASATPLPVLRAAELYAPLSTPLLDPEGPAETWSAMLAALDAAGTVALLLPYLASEGPATVALREAAQVSGRPLAVLGAHRRAYLESPLGSAGYLGETLERRRRKEAERQRRRLAETGEIGFAVAESEAEVAGALEDFLRLEGAGWKGREGTDLGSAAGGAAYIREAARAGARTGAFRVASLRRDGRIVAAGLVAIAGRRAFYVKTAYDEDFARFSPGMLLTLDLTSHLLDDPAVEAADSVAVADHPMIDRLWTGRLAIESVLVGTAAGGGVPFRAALALERARLVGRRGVKAMLGRLRGSTSKRER